jgi:glutamate/aspartate transport system permease protein
VQYIWDWGVLVRAPYLHWLLSGVGWTLTIACAASLIALVLGSAIGICRTLPWPALRALGTVYVEVFRNVPLLLQMFLWFFVLPEILPLRAGHWMKREMAYPEVTSAIFCLGFFTAARVAEQVRAGVESVAGGLAKAALASGLTQAQAYRYILLPIAFRLIVPPLTSEFLGVFKNSSVALTIGVLELTAQSRQIENYTFHGFEAFAGATLLYLVITVVVLVSTRRLEARTRVPGMLMREQA